MIYVVLAVLLAVAGVIAVDEVLSRRRVASRSIGLDRLLRERIATLVREGTNPWATIGAAVQAQEGEGSDPDLYEMLDVRTDPNQFRPLLAEGVEQKVFELRWGNDYAMVANPTRSQHYKLEVWEADLLPLMDGARTSADLVAERLSEEGNLETTGVTSLVAALHTGGFLDPPPIDVPEAVAAHLDPATPARRKIRTFAKTLSIDWSGANRLVTWCYRWLLRPFFHPIGAIVGGLIAAAGFAAFIAAQGSGDFSLGGNAAPSETVILLLLSFVLTFAHELAHASVMTHFGRRVKSAGFMIYFGSPAFFVEASDSLMMERGQRILQSAAGPFAELVLAGIASLILIAFPDSGVADVLFKFAVLNYFVIFLNLIPLLELDGYWILSDLIQMPDLRPRSLQFIQKDLWHKLRVREHFTPQEIGLGLYGFVGILFTVFSFYGAYFFWEEIFGGLIASLWNGGVGPRMLLLVLALFLGGPAIRGLIKMVRTMVGRGKAIWAKIKFRLETSWRIEAAELIDALPVFDDLPGEVLSDLAGRVGLRTVRPGQAAFRQGDRADAFYVVRKGAIQLEDEHPETGDTRVLQTLGRGEAFGEMALLTTRPRQATARAVGEVELFQVDRGTFDRLLADSIHAPTFAPTMQSLAELRELPVFRYLRSESLSYLLDHGDWVEWAPGDEPIVQGEPGDAFYAIASGQADVIRDGEVIAAVGSGAYVGEAALLTDAPRNATVRARTPVRAYRLDREGFEQVVAEGLRDSGATYVAERTETH
ncbi:MAG: cyclic nucleotide-binding domain-containing protein [Actinomycetota bacterium]